MCQVTDACMVRGWREMGELQVEADWEVRAVGMLVGLEEVCREARGR